MMARLDQPTTFFEACGGPEGFDLDPPRLDRHGQENSPRAVLDHSLRARIVAKNPRAASVRLFPRDDELIKNRGWRNITSLAVHSKKTA